MNIIDVWIDVLGEVRPVVPCKVTMQGQSLRFKTPCWRLPPLKRSKRGIITEFSRKSRLRLLKRMAITDWKGIGESTFITLTYPDEVIHSVPTWRNMQRAHLMRKMEAYAGKHLCGVWRVEHKPRLSGHLTGNILPHIHLLVYDCPFIYWETFADWWGAIIGSEARPFVWMKRVPAGSAASFYVAKYCAKVDPPPLLENVPYLTRTGRHYGYMRSNEHPTCPEVVFPELDEDLIHYLRLKATTQLPYLDLRYRESFTLLGEFARAIGDEVLRTALDRQLADR